MYLIGKVTGINTSDGMLNITVEDKENNIYNLKISNEAGADIKINDVYDFDCFVDNREGRIHYNVASFSNVREFDYEKKRDALRDFYKSTPVSAEESEKIIYDYIERIQNDNIKQITLKVLNKFHDDFFLYPAATKMHHNYVGGLSYHVIGMLELAEAMLKIYPYLNPDYLYAGIILHDVSKTEELTDPVVPQYSAEGQLIGHLVMGAMEIKLAAKELGIEKAEEALVLEHLLISHHGVPQFGAARKPMIAEALLLWYIDTIDSKFRVLEEELPKIEEGDFTQPIAVLDKTKFYKI